MNSYDRIYGLILEAPLSRESKQTLALNRLSQKSFKKKDFNRALAQTVKRELVKLKIKTSPMRDIIRAAAQAQMTEAKSGDLSTYIISSPYRAMSGGTRAQMKELKAIKRRAKKKGGKEVGTDLEGRTFDVTPKTFRGSVRRARKAKRKGQRKKFLASVLEARRLS